MEDVATAALPVRDLRTVGGEQVEQLVVGVPGDLGTEPGGELGDASLVLGLGGEGAQGGTDVGPVVWLLRRPAVERGANGGAVAATRRVIQVRTVCRSASGPIVGVLG